MPKTMSDLAQLPAASYKSNAFRVDAINYYNDKGEACEQKKLGVCFGLTTLKYC